MCLIYCHKKWFWVRSSGCNFSHVQRRTDASSAQDSEDRLHPEEGSQGADFQGVRDNPQTLVSYCRSLQSPSYARNLSVSALLYCGVPGYKQFIWIQINSVEMLACSHQCLEPLVSCSMPLRASCWPRSHGNHTSNFVGG